MKISTIDWIAIVRAGGAIKRCHTIPTHHNQTVAQHSWGVAMLIHRFKPEVSKDLLLAALFHDVAEYFTGDVPAQAKWEFPKLKQALDDAETQYEQMLGIKFNLTEEDILWLKSCDYIDLMLWCLDEMFMGNQNMATVFGRVVDNINENFVLPAELRPYFSFIVTRFYEAYPKEGDTNVSE